MWLQNVSNGRYYPYNEFLEQHYDMIKVYNNPFTTPETQLKKESVEDAEERRFGDEDAEDFETIEEIIAKPVKPPIKKGKTKK